MANVFRTLMRKAPRMLATTAAVRNIPTRSLSITPTLLKPRVQELAPNFCGTAVIDGSFKTIKLDDFKGQYVVLFFYPLDFTFVCPTELIALNERIEDFEKINTKVIGVSIDSHFSHLAWINTPRSDGGLGKINYPLLSDLKKTISRDYDVLLEDEGIALRGMFIIDKGGILRHITVNDLPIGRCVDEILRVVEALQFVEEHGEVCPANWKKGDKTIKPDPKGSQEYFKSTHK